MDFGILSVLGAASYPFAGVPEVEADHSGQPGDERQSDAADPLAEAGPKAISDGGDDQEQGQSREKLRFDLREGRSPPLASPLSAAPNEAATGDGEV